MPDFNIEAIFREVPVVRDGGVSEVQPALERLQPQRGLHLQGPPCPTCKLDNHKIVVRQFVSQFTVILMFWMKITIFSSSGFRRRHFGVL